jgi:hypothetical protein
VEALGAEAAGAGKKGPFFTSIEWVGIFPDLMLISEKEARRLINDQEVTIFGAIKKLKENYQYYISLKFQYIMIYNVVAQ